MESKRRLEASLEGKMEFKWHLEASLKAKLASKWRLEARLEAKWSPRGAKWRLEGGLKDVLAAPNFLDSGPFRMLGPTHCIDMKARAWKPNPAKGGGTPPLTPLF